MSKRTNISPIGLGVSAFNLLNKQKVKQEAFKPVSLAIRPIQGIDQGVLSAQKNSIAESVRQANVPVTSDASLSVLQRLGSMREGTRANNELNQQNAEAVRQDAARYFSERNQEITSNSLIDQSNVTNRNQAALQDAMDTVKRRASAAHTLLSDYRANQAANKALDEENRVLAYEQSQVDKKAKLDQLVRQSSDLDVQIASETDPVKKEQLLTQKKELENQYSQLISDRSGLVAYQESMEQARPSDILSFFRKKQTVPSQTSATSQDKLPLTTTSGSQEVVATPSQRPIFKFSSNTFNALQPTNVRPTLNQERFGPAPLPLMNKLYNEEAPVRNTGFMRTVEDVILNKNKSTRFGGPAALPLTTSLLRKKGGSLSFSERAQLEELKDVHKNKSESIKQLNLFRRDISKLSLEHLKMLNKHVSEAIRVENQRRRR